MLFLLFCLVPRREVDNLETYMVIWEEKRPQAKKCHKRIWRGEKGSCKTKMTETMEEKERKDTRESFVSLAFQCTHKHYPQQSLHDPPPPPPPNTHFLPKSQRWTDVPSITEDIYLRHLIPIAFHGSTVNYLACSPYPNFPYSKWTESHFSYPPKCGSAIQVRMALQWPQTQSRDSCFPFPGIGLWMSLWYRFGH